ncbi:hypothetical protein HanXRQr2_Chr17g0810461 [Helianthus annuus]|uniref:Uncharacterized protein n=1 Tax=Helianthus annuus TaxID=4232 RepID=A0A9K3GVT6_HELAN|nr:hypothetical protein HanXRQr2_Chr17g0810461 [Helianthus annuus]
MMHVCFVLLLSQRRRNLNSCSFVGASITKNLQFLKFGTRARMLQSHPPPKAVKFNLSKKFHWLGSS